MGSLRADALFLGRFIERRAGSIGMLVVSSQRKLGAAVVLSSFLACFAVRPKSASATGAAATPTPGTLAPASPAPASGQPSPFTGADGPGAPVLPPAPPPAGAVGSVAALPAAPPPKGAPVALPPGVAGSDLPPLPPPPRGVRYHDGFYLRMALGLGASGALVSSDEASVPNYSFAGGGATGDLWIGGTPSTGLALGGALSLLGVKSTTRRVDGVSRSGDVSGTMGLLGFFVDGFPDPERGFHFGGSLGLASARTTVKSSQQDEFKGGGVGLAAWLGYDMWVSPQWSLGGLVRFMGSLTRENRDDVNYQTSLGGASLSFTALYH